MAAAAPPPLVHKKLEHIIDDKLERMPEPLDSNDVADLEYYIAQAVGKKYPLFKFDDELYKFPLRADCLDGTEGKLRAAISVSKRRKNRRAVLDKVMMEFGDAACKRMDELGEVRLFMENMHSTTKARTERKRARFEEEMKQKQKRIAKQERALMTYFGAVNEPAEDVSLSDDGDDSD